VNEATSTKWAQDPPLPETPYQRAEAVWNDRLGTAAKQAASWRLAAFIALLIAFISVCGMIYLGQLPKTEVELVQIDKLGKAVYTGQAGESMAVWKPTEKQIEFHVRRFIRLTRSISSDMIVVRENWKMAYNYIADEAINQLNTEARTQTPVDRMEKERVNVAIEDTLRLSDDTWQVDWREQLWSPKGVPMGTQHWRGTFRIALRTPQSKDDLVKNPLGMFVTHYAWSQVIR